MSSQDVINFARNQPKAGSKAEQLGAAMAQRIVDGRILAGSLLTSENELSLSYGLSRPHVRQALQRLAAAGLIETRHGLGSYVKSKEYWNLFDPLLLDAFVESGNLAAIAGELVELRKMVEVESARLAATKITELEIRDLKRWLEQMDASLDNAEAMAQGDILFHDVIITASCNRFLKGIMTYLHELLARVRLLTMQTGQKDGRLRAQSHHRAIYAALAAKDVDASEAAMTMHMQQLEEDMRQALLLISV